MKIQVESDGEAEASRDQKSQEITGRECLTVTHTLSCKRAFS